MAITRRLKSAFLALLTVVGILLWFIALLLFTRVTENSDDFAGLQSWIVPINSIGIAVLLVLIIVNVSQLIRDYRRQVPGSRLRARMVTVLALVAITPLVGVYIFSVEFINRGIDNWFNVDIEKGLKTCSARPDRVRHSVARQARGDAAAREPARERRPARPLAGAQRAARR